MEPALATIGSDIEPALARRQRSRSATPHLLNRVWLIVDVHLATLQRARAAIPDFPRVRGHPRLRACNQI
ncbi:hypothetical protein BDZ89DRAFT_1061430 [Hymenopellis radicata]|nr:hypothetical protein BDZ89DRAFT_1061430 [Hymenopellis radicata]